MEKTVPELVVEFLPKWRIWALGMTRDPVKAADLVQDVAQRALAAADTFVPGTSFSKWSSKIMVHRYIDIRNDGRELCNLEDIPNISVRADHEDKLALRELDTALKQLPPEQRDAIIMFAIEEIPYEAAAEITGCPTGTLKSRLHRARSTLREILEVEKIDNPRTLRDGPLARYPLFASNRYKALRKALAETEEQITTRRGLEAAAAEPYAKRGYSPTNIATTLGLLLGQTSITSGRFLNPLAETIISDVAKLTPEAAGVAPGYVIKHYDWLKSDRHHDRGVN